VQRKLTYAGLACGIQLLPIKNKKKVTEQTDDACASTMTFFVFFWQGNAAFRRKDFESAVEYFTQVTGTFFFFVRLCGGMIFLEGGCIVSLCLSA